MNNRVLLKALWNYQSLRKCSYKPIKRPSLSQLKDPTKTCDKKIVQQPPLNEFLKTKIKALGPITVAEYMKECLTNENGGYYMHKDVFGREGDFITSPEIGQIFGELVAVWLYTEWQKIGSPKPFQLIELGPGRGTLIQDVLRVLSQFKGMSDCMSLHLIEVSPHLSGLQAKRLCCQYRHNQITTEDRHYCRGETLSGIPVMWYHRIDDVPRHFSIVLAHEFFDAMPIHKFQKTDNGKWREVMIDFDQTTNMYQYVVSSKETPMLKVLLSNLNLNEQQHVEYSVESHCIIQHLAERLEENGGFSLIMDYGHNGEKGDTFRGFKNHQLHNPLIEPGTADLTADVDFKQMKQFAETNDKLISFGPVNQQDFIKKLGGDIRIENLIQQARPDNRKQLETGYEMLTDPKQMGVRFKFFSMFPSVLQEHLRKYPPSGFD